MVLVDFNIFYTDGSYGHVNGCLDIAVPHGPGASINLSGIVSTPAPPFFSGRLLVESVLTIEGAGNLYACKDVYVASKKEALLLGEWLDHLPGLSVWSNESGDPLTDYTRAVRE